MWDRRFKYTCEIEDYITFVQVWSKCFILVQLRMGVLPLNIETGRFKGITVN